MLIEKRMQGADWLRELLTADELYLLGLNQDRTIPEADRAMSLAALQDFRLLVRQSGRLAPQPNLSQVNWQALLARAGHAPTPAWQVREQASVALHTRLLQVFEAASGLRPPTPRGNHRAAFLLGHEWLRPLRTLYHEVGGDLARLEALLRQVVQEARGRGNEVRCPQDVRQAGLNAAAPKESALGQPPEAPRPAAPGR